MSGIFDNQDLEFTCPTCKGKVKKRVSTLKQSGQSCPHCGTKFETSGFRRDVDEVDREIERFTRDLGNIKIDINL